MFVKLSTETSVSFAACCDLANCPSLAVLIIHKVLRPVHKGVCHCTWPRSLLATWISFSLMKPFMSRDICISLGICVRMHMCVCGYMQGDQCPSFMYMYVYITKKTDLSSQVFSLSWRPPSVAVFLAWWICPCLRFSSAFYHLVMFFIQFAHMAM